MKGLWKRLTVVALSIFGFTVAALAHTADISTGKISEKERVYRVEVGFLATDLEKMFSDSMAERSGVDLSPPGVLETEIGKFVQRRVFLEGADGRACPSTVESAGEDPTNADSALVHLRFDCRNVAGSVFYNVTKLLQAAGPRGKHHTFVGEGADAGQTVLDASDARIDLSQPLATMTQLVGRYLYAGVEHILTGWDHICFLLSVVLWASRAWPVIKIVTAFTLSHSVTLSMAVLGVAAIPSYYTEAAIAASIIYVAAENFFSRKVDKRWRDTFLFGFVHGFGFASGLMELGVPQYAIVPALASFNVGVEIGQIAIVGLVIPLLVLVDDKINKGKRDRRLVYAGSAFTGMAGAYWLITRLGAFG